MVKKHRIKFLADIHGADNSRNFKLCVGIIDNNIRKCSCPTFKDTIKRACIAFQDKIFNLERLTASSPRTLTNFAKNKLGIEAAQFEINRRYRVISRLASSTAAKRGIEPNFKAKEKNVLELLRVMESVVKNIFTKIAMENMDE